MKLSKLFPKTRMDEIFNKYGFESRKPTDGILYLNQFDIPVNIYRHRFKKGMFFLTSNVFSSYGIKIDGYKREWDDDEAQECMSFIENKLLPVICNLKGPYQIDPDIFFKKIEYLFSKYVKNKCKKGNMDFDIPVDNIEVMRFNYDYLKFDLGESKTLFFLKNFKIYRVLINENTNNIKLYAWYDFADREKEGDELIVQMVENLAVFLKLKQ